MRGAGLLVLGVMLAPGLLACGGATLFPEPAPCVAPTAVPTTRSPSSQYFASVRRSVEQIATLREQLRASYPGDKFSRTSQFRLDFAAYADNTACVAQALMDIEPTTAAFEPYDADLDAALQALIEHTAAGREAVRKRNVSDYRAWYQGVDSKIDAVKTASNASRPR
ncbi:MAG: hypothetical protein C0506_09935 [Anaerolinea sp.]|nr:hypothetical protein [Anaerolinea sp.]